jgi:hypothetical protein
LSVQKNAKDDQASGKRGLKTKKRINLHLKRRWIAIGGGVIVVLLIASGAWLVSQGRASEPTEAPEAQLVLDVQANMPFQILIPAFLPKEFEREKLQIDVRQTGPGGEPMAQLTYPASKGQPLFIRQWVPVNPEKEILAASRPVQTKWGQGWLLKQGEGLIAIWIDIGPLRASIYTSDQQVIDKEHLLAIAETMGPASNRQVFDFVVDPPEVRAVEPPPPFEAPVNADGVQEIDLVVTPGGYSPLRFSVQKGVPVKLTFRQLGRVGCGNELNLPYGQNLQAGLKLDDPADKEVLEFTPQDVGDFTFFCAHVMYKGIMTVRE